MKMIDPQELPPAQVYRYMVGAIGPRPIALVATCSADGERNLAPFSFFNVFSPNPPVVGFSPCRRGRDKTLKDTYHNLVATQECTVQVVTFDMAEQVNIASTEFDASVDEFQKSGLTPLPSDLVTPPRVQESPFQMECRLQQMIPLGDQAISGNLALCEVIRMHVDESILVDGLINPHRIDVVGRNGQNFYTRASGDAIFEVPRPAARTAVGYEHIPQALKDSQLLTAHHLTQLALFPELPSEKTVKTWKEGMRVSSPVAAEVAPVLWEELKQNKDYQKLFQLILQTDPSPLLTDELECVVQLAVDAHDIEFAWKAIACCSQT